MVFALIPSTLIGKITKLNIEMQQKPLVGIMYHIFHKADYNSSGLAFLLISFYMKTEMSLETLHNSLKKVVYWQICCFLAIHN